MTEMQSSSGGFGSPSGSDGEKGGRGGESREAFDSRPTVPSGKGTGCSRPLVVGCGVLLVLLGVAAVLFVLYAGQIAAWAYGKAQTQIVNRLPEELSDEEEQRLVRAFEEFRQAVENGTVDPDGLTEVQAQVLALLQSQEEPTVEDIRELTEALEAAAARDSPAQESASAGLGAPGAQAVRPSPASAASGPA